MAGGPGLESRLLLTQSASLGTFSALLTASTGPEVAAGGSVWERKQPLGRKGLWLVDSRS